MQSGAYIAVEGVIIRFSGGPKRIFTSVFTTSDLERTQNGRGAYSQLGLYAFDKACCWSVLACSRNLEGRRSSDTYRAVKQDAKVFLRIRDLHLDPTE